MTRPFLTDELWKKLEPVLPPEQGGMGRRRRPNRPMVEAVLWKHWTGRPWRHLPAAFGPWISVYTRFVAWSERGVWRTVLEILKQEADPRCGPLEEAIIRD